MRSELSLLLLMQVCFGGNFNNYDLEPYQVVQEGHSVLLFCSSRKGCESTATHIAKYLKKFSVSSRSDQSEFIDVTSAIDTLQRSPAGLDPVLEATLPTGVAYHHAGLTVSVLQL